MGLFRKPATREQPTALTPDAHATRHWVIRPEFIISGAEAVSDDDGIIVVDISGVPSGVTAIRLVNGALSATYPFDIDGHRVREPERTVLRFHAPR